jgi:hypothetical protein
MPMAVRGADPLLVLRYYRQVLRQVRRLPGLEQAYYAQYARSQFMGHSDEFDDARIQQVADSGMQSLRWVLAKYDITDELPDSHPLRPGA